MLTVNLLKLNIDSDMQKILIIIILFMSLFAGLFYSLGLPTYFQIISELIIYLLFISVFLSRSQKNMPLPNMWLIVVYFVIITICSILINNSSAIRSIFSIRLLFRFLLFYWAIILMSFDEKVLKNLNNVLLLFLVLQFPIIFVKFLKHGISEATMGGYAIHDGSIATTLSITVIFYLSALYFIFERKQVFIWIGIGYILFSVVSAKRAVLFLYPIQFMAIFYYFYAKGTNVQLTKKYFAFIVSISIVVMLGVSILYLNKTLNPDNKVGGTIDPGYALEYAAKYNTGIKGDGNSYGRIATTQRIVEALTSDGIGKFLFGLGPGFATRSLLDNHKSREKFEKGLDELGIDYGITSMTKIALEYGISGVLVYGAMLFMFLLNSFKWYKLEIDSYWKAFAGGTVGFAISMIFFAFSYHSTALWGDTMPVLYFYAMAVAHTRYKKVSEPVNSAIRMLQPSNIR